MKIIALLLALLAINLAGCSRWTLAQTKVSVCKTGCDYTTIQAAVNAAAAGVVIEVHGGTYNEAVIIGTNGTSSNWITLRARANDIVWIDSGSHTKVSNIDLGNHAYWKIIGLKMRLAAQGVASGADGSPPNACDGVTIGRGGHDVILQNLTIESPNGDGVDLRGGNFNIQILDSEIYDMRIENPNSSGDGHGIHVLQERGVASSHDILVKNNYVHNSNGKACLALSDYSALDAPRPTNIIFEHNMIKDCTMGIKVNADGIFRYNTIFDTGPTNCYPKCYDGFQAYTHDSENNVRNAQIYNNTVVGYDNSYSFANSTPEQTVSVFQNNIGYDPDQNYVSVKNTYFGNHGSNLFYAGDSSPYSGYAPPNSTIIADPLLTNPLAGDVSLKIGSTAIDAGVVIYSGQPYSGLRPDIGAFESGGAETTITPSPSANLADINRDGKVNSADLKQVLAAWGNALTTAPENIYPPGKPDTKVNALDAGTVLGNWTNN